MALANELDWPMQNWATGMSDNCWEDDLPHFGGDDLPSQSIYRKYVEWNRCALNDYQTQVLTTLSYQVRYARICSRNYDVKLCIYKRLSAF